MTTPPAIDHSGDPRVGVAAKAGGLLCVVPVIADFTGDRCIPSILAAGSSAGLAPEDILIVDNSRDGWAGKYGLRTWRHPDGHNCGTSRSWNVGAREVLERGLDYLLICSTSMVFGPMLHTTWVEQMERFWGENVIEATGHSWHLIAFHRRVFERVGLFDENFFCYEEAIDFGYRMHMVGWSGGWANCWVNALSLGHALHVDLCSLPAAPLLAWYASKWRGKKGEEQWTLPWGDRPLDYWPAVTIPELAERQGWTNWW